MNKGLGRLVPVKEPGSASLPQTPRTACTVRGLSHPLWPGTGTVNQKSERGDPQALRQLVMHPGPQERSLVTATDIGPPSPASEFLLSGSLPDRLMVSHPPPISSHPPPDRVNRTDSHCSRFTTLPMLGFR